ncbi:MAG TPA: hypothetical protein VKV28_03100 [Candidatus Binataceae bacterium]|nr:hypothetical protein [Candidatus Binataceae bacterium]
MNTAFRRWPMWGVFALLAAACAPAWVPVIGKNPEVQTHAVLGIKTVRIHRIAVLPLINAAGVPDDAGDTITAELQARMALEAEWDLVPASDVDDALSKLPPTTANNLQSNALALGKAVQADGVIYGKVQTYRERVGADYAAASPAEVAFSLDLVALSNKQVIWSARFEREQQSLTENVFEVYDFIKHQGRWLLAHEIAQQGVDQAVKNLHSKLNLQEQIEHFKVPQYEGPFDDNSTMN